MDSLVVFDGTSAFVCDEDDFRENYLYDEECVIDSTWSDIDDAQLRVDILNSEIMGND